MRRSFRFLTLLRMRSFCNAIGWSSSGSFPAGLSEYIFLVVLSLMDLITGLFYNAMHQVSSVKWHENKEDDHQTAFVYVRSLPETFSHKSRSHKVTKLFLVPLRLSGDVAYFLDHMLCLSLSLSATISATSFTWIFPPSALDASFIIVRQKGHPTATVVLRPWIWLRRSALRSHVPCRSPLPSTSVRRPRRSRRTWLHCAAFQSSITPADFKRCARCVE